MNIASDSEMPQKTPKVFLPWAWWPLGLMFAGCGVEFLLNRFGGVDLGGWLLMGGILGGLQCPSQIAHAILFRILTMVLMYFLIVARALSLISVK